MDILIKAEEILSATKYKSGKACLWVGGFQKAVEIPEHGDLVDRDAVATAMREYLLNHLGERLDEDLSNAIYALIAEAEVVLERT